MNATEVLEALKKYKECEGQNFLYRGRIFECRKVIAAPLRLDEFTPNYQAYVENSEKTVAQQWSDNYTVYFYKNPYGNPAWFLTLNDFIRDCMNGQEL